MRGFNRFRDFGVTADEIHMLRILFHTAFLTQNRQSKNIYYSNKNRKYRLDCTGHFR